MAEVNPFSGCGQAPGLTIWGVNQFALELIASAEHGTFYAGDSYLVLHTFKPASSSSSALRHNIHFWLGSQSSLDEQGSAAILAAQLDEHLGGTAVQYRQVQGSEDDEFRKLFPRVSYRPSGRYSSGFTSAAKVEAPTKLHHIKSPSRTSVNVSEVALSVSSLNSGDSFVLETASKLYVWHGSAANLREKMGALDVANSMRPAGSAIKVTVVDDGDTSSADAVDFFSALGASDPSSVVVPAAVPDTAASATTAAAATLGGGRARVFKVSADAEPQELSGGPSRAQLDSDGLYCVVAGNSAWVWVGSEAKAGASFGLGSRVLAHVGLPASSAVRCIKEGYEPALFTTYFPDWAQESAARARAAAAQAASDTPSSKASAVDASALASGMLGADGAVETERKKLQAALDKFGVDGELQAWVVRGSELQALPAAEAGQLFSSDSYVVDYLYKDGSGEPRHVVYFWLGRQSSNGEQGTAALLATEKHHSYNGNSTLTRVAQGQEPPHFVRVFSEAGGLVIHRGNRPPSGTPAGDSTRLYQVKAEAALGGPYAAEVETTVASLNSGDSFLLLPADSSELWQWQGKLSNPQERAAATAAAQRLAGSSRTVTVVKEGSEGSEFWEALGGQGEYPAYDAAHAPWAQQPSMFILRETGGSGGVRVERYSSYSQDDLCAEDVALLDTGRELLLWYGPGSSATERKHAKDIAEQYSSQLGQRAVTEVPVTEVHGGSEPPFFTQHFPGWDSRPRPSIVDVYANKLKSLSVDA